MNTFGIFLIFGVIVIAFGYVAQLWSALKSRDRSPKVAPRLWRTVATIFIVPMLISVVVALSDVMLVSRGQVAPEDLGLQQPIGYLGLLRDQVSALLSIIQSMLLIFISLELSHLTLAKLPQKWRDLLSIALVLDVAALVIVYAVRSDSYQTYEAPMLLGLLSILSSFVIVLLARENVENRLEAAT